MDATDDLTPQEETRLQTHIQACLGSRGRHIRVVCRDNGVILHGNACTYHAKQLAQHVVMQATHLPIVANHIEVVDRHALNDGDSLQ